MTLTALVIDDQASILESMEMFFKLREWEVYTANTGQEGLHLALELRPHLVVLDIRLPDASGLNILERLRGGIPDTQVIMITAYQDMDSTIKAIKLGAFDYIHKPIDIKEMDATIRRFQQIIEVRDVSDDDADPQEAIVNSSGPQIIAKSRAMKEVFKTIALVSTSRVTVLIQGESGTGKELIARTIHHNSHFSKEPFTVMDCSTFVDTLMESELFGYEKGAFTGATETRKGRLELTGDGTIFFDEIGELPLHLQSKLLRFLQAKEFVRVGGARAIHSNARIIAATNRNLTKLARDGRFREDLYYRLKVVTIEVPPLRDRCSDIPLLSSFLLKKISTECGIPLKRLSPEAMQHLIERDWPGNVRELENTLTRAAVMTKSAVLTREDTAPYLRSSEALDRSDLKIGSIGITERENVRCVLESCQGHLGKACHVLGISRPTLRSRMRKLGLSKNTGKLVK